MELKINIWKLIAFAVLIITIIIGSFILNHQNNAIKKLNKYIDDQKIEHFIYKQADSIKYKQLELKVFEDSINTAKLYREKELNLAKTEIKLKRKQHEKTIEILPDASNIVRDSIWKSELIKPEEIVK